MVLERNDLESLLFGPKDARRFTQDSPVLPDVWFRFGEKPLEQVDLLLTPHQGTTAGELAKALRLRLEQERRDHPTIGAKQQKREPSALAYAQGNVVVKLYFDEVVRVVLPMTQWWQKYVWGPSGLDLEALRQRANTVKQTLLTAIRSAEEKQVKPSPPTGTPRAKMSSPLRGKALADFVWMLRVVGSIAAVFQAEGQPKTKAQPPGLPFAPEQLVGAAMDVAAAFQPPEPGAAAMVWLVSRNRGAGIAVSRSVLATKADAARRLFQISCSELAWAVIDSGIDATHPAFRLRDGNNTSFPEPFTKEADKDTNHTRVLATYDFNRVRPLLDPSNLDLENPGPLLKEALQPGGELARQIRQVSEELRQSLLNGREVDWDLLEPLLRVPHDGSYDAGAIIDHGTHVAGILAADWERDDPEEPVLRGMCPDLRLYDLRVLGPDGAGDEFAVIAALQFVRHLNARKDYFVIHGVNLSLSIPHDVANYACGRTPVCEECERAVGAGIVVVAAAGNQGYSGPAGAGSVGTGYHDISITDPGNTEGVITVGATHRYRPHTYGVSYFSSRGPTADGRAKPDLVAPGEKITGPVPGGESRRMDGTSMATPHVSGAAALLMGRYSELIGDPVRLKDTLCRTATDLGRERYFQGCGMLDVLRALQSV